MSRLATEFCGLTLRSPIIVGSAGITRSPEMMERAQLHGAGAVIGKGFSDLSVMRRSPSPRYTVLRRRLGRLVADTFYSYEQASEHDADEYAAMLAEAKRRLDIPVIANIDCQEVESWVEVAKVVGESGCDAMELNVSCPHGSIAFSGHEVEERIVEVAAEVRKVVTLPLIVKLTPQLTSPASLVARLEETGVEGVTLFNRFLGLEVDVSRGRPILHGGYGGHGGPWMHNLVMRWVAGIAPVVRLDISASGGTATGRDAAALILAGARTVQVCSVVYLEGWGAVGRINAELEQVLDELDAESVNELWGQLQGRILGMEEVDRRKVYVAEVRTRGVAPCQARCPLQEDVQGYVNLLAEGKADEALRLIVANHPFPHVLGRCCDHPCEEECVRGQVDDPIAIRELKRVAAEVGERYGPVRAERRASTHRSVAVVGAGPAGLTAAYRLALLGHRAVVFEKLPVAGGMLAAGIPRYRLPWTALERDLARVWEAGVELRTGTALGRDFGVEELFEQGFDAVVIACGAHKPRALGVSGEDMGGVVQGLEFLSQFNMGDEPPAAGGEVAVIGGGDVAIDAARAARRLGARVTVVYRRRREDMPAREEEVEQAMEEGVELAEQLQPVELRRLGDGRIEIVCARTEPGEVGPDGRASFRVIEGETRSVLAETVLVAVGQEVDAAALVAGGLEEIVANGRVAADEATGLTAIAGVFACGDAVTGPGSLVEAIAAGKRVGLSVDAWLRGEEPTAEMFELPLPVVRAEEAVEAAGGADIILTRRQRPRMAEASKRVGDVREVNLGLSQRHAQAEAARCLACGGCGGCGDCIRICPYEALHRARIVEVDEEACDGCGLCTIVCQQGAIEMVKRTGEAD